MSFNLSSFGEHVCICGPPLWLELEMTQGALLWCHVHVCVTWPAIVLILSLLSSPLTAIVCKHGENVFLSLQWEDFLVVPACSEVCRKRELSPIRLPLPSRSAALAWKGQPSSIAPPSQEYPVQVSVKSNCVYYSGVRLKEHHVIKDGSI